jgi:class 3 adenylate cyclase/pimeloyl-ACP methyl ester carboxylesterase
MQPRIQYAQTKDGVSIAFCVMGSGMPLLHLPLTPITHTQMSWQIPQYRRWLEGLARGRMLVLWDWRGCGLSGRGVNDFSIDALTLDLEAVAAQVGADRFALFAMANAVPLALTHAAHHPDRVSHLLLWHGYASYAGGEGAGAIAPHRDVARRSIDAWARMMAPLLVDEDAPAELTQQVRRMLGEGTDADSFALMLEQTKDWDATAQLAHVESPVLVLQRRRTEMPSIDIARSLATGIPKAELVVLDGDAWAPFAGDTDSVLRAIDEFLGEGQEAAGPPELPEGMAVLLFADIAESTALTEQLGDAAFRAKARELDTSLRTVIEDSGGTPVEGKVLGDGVLAVFTSARQAIDCALRCEAAGEPLGLKLHLGIHAGDIIREGNNVYGGAVNIAARVASASTPDEILVSDIVRGLARTSAGVTFDDRGEHELKGVGEPQRLFAVRGGG